MANCNSTYPREHRERGGGRKIPYSQKEVDRWVTITRMNASQICKRSGLNRNTLSNAKHSGYMCETNYDRILATFPELRVPDKKSRDLSEYSVCELQKELSLRYSTQKYTDVVYTALDMCVDDLNGDTALINKLKEVCRLCIRGHMEETIENE